MPLKLIVAAILLVLAGSGSAFAQARVVLSVMSASVGHDGQTGQPALRISLAGDGRQALADFTAERVGQMVDVLVGGDVVTSPWINTPIDSDWIIVTGAFSGGELDAMAERINRGGGEVVLRAHKNKSGS